MHMGVHQFIIVELKSVSGLNGTEQFQIGSEIGVGFEQEGPMIATGNHVVMKFWNLKARGPSHVAIL